MTSTDVVALSLIAVVPASIGFQWLLKIAKLKSDIKNMKEERELKFQEHLFLSKVAMFLADRGIPLVCEGCSNHWTAFTPKNFFGSKVYARLWPDDEHYRKYKVELEVADQDTSISYVLRPELLPYMRKFIPDLGEDFSCTVDMDDTRVPSRLYLVLKEYDELCRKSKDIEALLYETDDERLVRRKQLAQDLKVVLSTNTVA